MSDLSAVLTAEVVNSLKSEPQLLSGVAGLEKMSPQELDAVVTTLQPVLSMVLRDVIAKLRLRQIQLTGAGYAVTTADRRTIPLQQQTDKSEASMIAAAAVGMTGGNAGSTIKQPAAGSMARTQ